MTRRLLIGLILLVALTAASCGAEMGSSRGSDGFATIDGGELAFTDLDGQAALVLFWTPG